ncbi:thioredoxin family protein [Salinicoccus kekensis]|uniref:thioredoxin family protein n=1 Tax=Salinicoccus kekensis TaxID=714307 RepID=UPI001C547B09|nr:thioredoxin family protein [Salinicoccus kekensis]
MKVNLNDWFEKGLTFDEYEKELTDHEENYMKIYENFTLPEDAAFFRQTADSGVRAIIIAEPWCGHCMMNLPIFRRIAEKGEIDTRISLRDTHTELMDAYETDGKRVIPIIVLFNEDGQEVAKWGPRAPETTEIQKEVLRDMPEKGSDEYDKMFKVKVRELAETFAGNEVLWQHIYQDMKKKINTAI